MSRLKYWFILCTLLLTLGFGCKGLSEEERAAVRPVTLNYWTVYDNVDQLRIFADEYKKIRPYVTVNIQRVRYDEFENRFLNALADEVAPDIISVQNTALRQYATRLMTMPTQVQVANITIKGKYAQEPVITIEQLPMPTVRWVQGEMATVVAEDVIADGKIYGMPLAVDTLALYYNKDLLDQAGVAVAPKTWVEFFDAVKKSTKFDADGNILQSGVPLGTAKNIDNAFDVLSMLMLQNGVPMTVGNQVTFASGLERRIDNHPVLQALRFYTDFAQPTKEVYSWNNAQGNALDAFVQGKSVFYFGFAYDKERIKARAPQMDIEILPVPQLNASKPTNVANYWVQSVVKKTKNPDEAWDFIRFITDKPQVKKYVDAMGQVSPYRSHIAEQQQSETIGPFASQVLFSVNWYKGRNVVSTRTAFEDMVEQYLEPFDGPERLRRDSNIVINAARIVQQTM